MKRQFWGYGVLAALAYLPLAVGCDVGGVGDPCIPEEEYQTQFSGFALDEVNVESRSFQCETRICLVNHFQGRVSCPYGQTEDTVCRVYGSDAVGCSDAGAVGDGNAAALDVCRIPGASGLEDRNDAIEVAVEPQLEQRRPENAVYCSCRCDGPDPNARYCECPSGFACVELVKDLGLGSGQLAGSYCIVDGTVYDPAEPLLGVCDLNQGNCEDEDG